MVTQKKMTPDYAATIIQRAWYDYAMKIKYEGEEEPEFCGWDELYPERPCDYDAIFDDFF